MERDFANDYEEWLRLTGGDNGSGGTIPTEQSYIAPAPAPVASAPAPTATAPTTNTGGTSYTDPLSDPNKRPTSAPGGYEWYWSGDRWNLRQAGVNLDLPTAGTEYDGPAATSDYGSFDSSGFAWPQFSAPTFNAPPAFEFDAFKAPDFKSIFDDQSYQGRRDEGLRAISNSAAAKGLSRLPATAQALGAWNQDFASREYGNIFDRSANTWQMNRNNAADNYMKNYGVSRDVFDRNYKSAFDQFDFNEFRPAKATFDDLYNRWKAELDATTSIATAGAGI